MQTRSGLRVSLLAGHLCSPDPAAAASPLSRSGTDDIVRHGPPKLLTVAQLQSFIRDGYLALSIVDDMGSEWVESLYAKCVEHGTGTTRDPERPPLFATVSSEISELLACPTMTGALTSLLGGDYLLAAGEFANDGLKLHGSRRSEQGFHKDGTDHGPTQSTVRDHRPAHLIPMLYPMDTTIEMGPTSIIPGSNLLGVNREGFFHSEDRIRAELAAPQTLEEWGQSMAAFPENGSGAGDSERLASAVGALRSSGLQEHKLEVKAGTVVFMHHDLVHRGTKAEDGAPFRAMIAIRNCVRVSDPVSPILPAGAEIEATWPEAWQGEPLAPAHMAIWRYLSGGAPQITLPRSAAGQSAAEEEAAAETTQASLELIAKEEGESAALGAAYRLAALAAAGSEPAAETLVAAATTSSDEGTRRAASQALTAAGASSDSDNEASTQHMLVRLLGLLEGGIAGLAVPSSPQLHIDRAANVMVTVVHAIAQLTHWCENCTVVLVI
jgi:hypothetical protein